MRLNKKPFLIFKIALRYLILQIRGGWVLPKNSKKQKSVRLVFRKSCKSPNFCHACNKEIVTFKMLLFAYCKHGKRISFYEFYKKTPSLKDDVFYIFGVTPIPFSKKNHFQNCHQDFFSSIFSDNNN